MKLLYSVAILTLITYTQTAKADPYIANLLLDAKTNLKTLKTIETEVKSGITYEPCLVDRLLIQKNYIQWFLQQEKTLKTIESDFLKQLEPVQEIIKKLNHSTVKIENEKYSFHELVNFFKAQELRAKNIPQDQKELFEYQQENKSINQPAIRRSDAVRAVQDAIEALNEEALYPVRIIADFSNYGLKLKIRTRLNIQNYNKNTIITLNDSKPKSLKVTDESVWNILLKQNIKISRYSLDGSQRYIEMQSEMIDEDCTVNFSLTTESGKSIYQYQRFLYPVAAGAAIAEPKTTLDFITKHEIAKMIVTRSISKKTDSFRAPTGQSGCTFYNLNNKDYPADIVLRAQVIPGTDVVTFPSKPGPIPQPKYNPGDLVFYPVNSKGNLEFSTSYRIVCFNVGNNFSELKERLKNTGLELVI